MISLFSTAHDLKISYLGVENQPGFPSLLFMAIPLDDLTWSKLKTAYGDSCHDLTNWLKEAYAARMTEELLGNIINEIQHQGDTSEAMYAVAPHLIELAILSKEPMSRSAIIYAGLIHASAKSKNAVKCPPPLKADFKQSAEIGREMAARHLSMKLSFHDFQYLIAALAGFSGHGKFGLLIEGLELHDGKFYHSSLDAPFPE